MEAVFDDVKGVDSVESGYSGGKTENPSFGAICSGMTGHAEVVRISFDPSVVSYSELLEIFFAIHNPTTLNRQGNDTGTHYRSVIFYHSDSQCEAAQQAIRAVDSQGSWPDKVVTQVAPAGVFYMAEAYHQKYFAHHTSLPYCQFVVSAKVQKFREKFAGGRVKFRV